MRIGLVLRNLDEEYQITLYNGIAAASKEFGVELTCFQLDNTVFSPDSLLSRFPDEDFFNLDGIILVTTALIESNKLQSKKDLENFWGNIPVVSIGKKISEVPSVLVRGDNSMKELVEHLILKHKYRNFLYMGGRLNHTEGQEREKAFLDTINEYKKNIPELSYQIAFADFSESEAMQTISDYLEKNNHKVPDCVVCANDNMAMGVYRFFKIHKEDPFIHEPAVTGFDDIPQADFNNLSLTTIRQPVAELGREAAVMLLELIKGKKITCVHYLNSKVIYRKSCGCKVKNPSILSAEDYLNHISAGYVQTETLLRMLSQFGLAVNCAENIEQLSEIINQNMNQLGIQNFCILSFDNSTDVLNKNDDLYVKALYVRRSGLLREEFKGAKLTIGEFYKKYLLLENENPSLIFKCMSNGSEIMGAAIYEAEENFLPYLISLSMHIAQVLIRIKSNEEKKQRAIYLENEVNKRSRELVLANNKRMEVEAQVLKISEIERQRFSNDLHDDICQRLAGISMLCRSYTNVGKPVEQEKIKELAELINDTLQTTRQYAHNSYPVELESLGLNKSLSNLCNSFRIQSGIICDYEWEVDEKIIFTQIQKLNIFRIIQEALHNVLKHAKASNVRVTLKSDKKKLVVQIADNGCGFDFVNKNLTSGIGLNSMHYRANQIGAKFEIKKNKPAGTLVQVSVGL